MANLILSDTSASVSELKKTPWLPLKPVLACPWRFLTETNPYSIVCLRICTKKCLKSLTIRSWQR